MTDEKTENIKKPYVIDLSDDDILQTTAGDDLDAILGGDPTEIINPFARDHAYMHDEEFPFPRELQGSKSTF